MVTPVFLLSLPRSGSTLVSRVMATHPLISATAEPWVALPPLYALRDLGCRAEYGHRALGRAVHQLADDLPDGVEDYYKGVRAFLDHLYGALSSEGSHYFVDKTPRYHLIVDELFSVYPQAKFIFLWRNPLAVAASMIRTWGGKWNLHLFDVDLRQGLTALVQASSAYADRSLSVRFEDLVQRPDEEWPRLFEYLGAEFSADLVEGFAETRFANASGRGDPTGQKTYRSLSAEPLEKWKQILTNPVRRRWAKQYLKWVGVERLSAMGYDQEQLLGQLSKAPSTGRHMMSDLARMAYGALYCSLELGARRSRRIDGPRCFS